MKETSGIYNAETKLLEEAETLDHYSFDAKEKVLFDGTNKFKKIKLTATNMVADTRVKYKKV